MNNGGVIMSKQSFLKHEGSKVANDFIQGFLDLQRINMKQVKVNDYLLQDLMNSVITFVKTSERADTLNSFINNEFDLNLMLEELNIYNRKENYATFMTGMLYCLNNIFHLEESLLNEYDKIESFKSTSKYSLSILAYIDKNPGVRQKEIADAINIKYNHLSNVLRRLIDFDMFYFINEGREKVYFINKEGRKLLDTIYKENRNVSNVSFELNYFSLYDSVRVKHNHVVTKQDDENFIEKVKNEYYSQYENIENMKIKICDPITNGGKYYE